MKDFEHRIRDVEASGNQIGCFLFFFFLQRKQAPDSGPFVYTVSHLQAGGFTHWYTGVDKTQSVPASSDTEASDGKPSA